MSADAVDDSRILSKKALSAASLVEDHLPIVVLTGAGISVESNIPPFRGPGGLWERYDPYDHGHIDSFRRDPERSWRMLRDIIDGAIGSFPNTAHEVIARMEKKGWVKTVITQNVDGLHREAGSVNVLELHGNARSIFCETCGKKEIIVPETWKDFSIRCECGDAKRPEIVFFGDQLPEKEINRAFELANTGISMMIVGTSGTVQPAAMLPYVAHSNGGKIIEVNPFRTDLTESITDLHLEAKATIGLTALEKAFEHLFS